MGHDALPFGVSMEPVVSMSVDRDYPTGMGLRPKACPRPRKATSTATRSERSIQGPVDRCLTLVRALTPEVLDNSGVDACALGEAPVDVQTSLPSDPLGVRQEARPGQSANRGQDSVMVGCAASGAQMWDAVSHVRCSLQSYLG